MRSLVLIAALTLGAPALAHHPSAPPPVAAPHSIAPGSQLALTFDATEFLSPRQADASTMYRLSTEGVLHLAPWFALTGRMPVQMLRTSGEGDTGLGNLAIGGLLRRGNESFELVVSAELRLPTGRETAGAYQRSALAPQLLVALRKRDQLHRPDGGRRFW